MKLAAYDQIIISYLRRWFVPAARIALFVIFFWFGFLKLFDISPATPLAQALVQKTIGLQYFSASYHALALIECVIGVLFLVPKATRLVIPLLLLHIAVVSGPLFLVPHLTWQRAFVPTLEGQYIIKNVAIVALAIGIAAQTTPLRTARSKR